MNVTLGVPRVKEIINAAKTISTPIITTHLLNHHDVVGARIVKGRIEKTHVGDICDWIKECYNKTGCYLLLSLSMETINALQLQITAEDVKQAIVTRPRSKLKEKHVTVVDTNKLRIDPYDNSKEKMFFVLQILKNELPQISVSGIHTISRAVIQGETKNGKEEYKLLVEGKGLLDVMGIEGVDGKRATTNDIMEIEKILGIEAARSTIQREIKYTFSNYGIEIDPRHITLLSDIMTFKGMVLGITRFGVAKMKNSTLMLASFERTTDHLFDAAVHSRLDKIDGVSENIIMGNTVPIGTGMFKLVFDDNTSGEMPEMLQVEADPKDIDMDGTNDQQATSGKKKSRKAKKTKQQSIQREALAKKTAERPSAYPVHGDQLLFADCALKDFDISQTF